MFSLVIVRVALGISSETVNTRTRMTTFGVEGIGANAIVDSEPGTVLDLSKTFRGSASAKGGSEAEEYI